MNSHIYGVALLLNLSPLQRRAVCECPPHEARGILNVFKKLHEKCDMQNATCKILLAKCYMQKPKYKMLHTKCYL